MVFTVFSAFGRQQSGCFLFNNFFDKETIMSMRNQTLLAVLLCGVFGVAAADSGQNSYMGDSSNTQIVRTNKSDRLPFGAGQAGLSFNAGNGFSTTINCRN